VCSVLAECETRKCPWDFFTDTDTSLEQLRVAPAGILKSYSATCQAGWTRVIFGSHVDSKVVIEQTSPATILKFKNVTTYM